MFSELNFIVLLVLAGILAVFLGRILIGGDMTTTEILNALVAALVNRNTERDDESGEWWANFLRTHADMLEEKDDGDG